MNSTPKVSVIMPSLNVGQYIEECIASVVNQTLKDIEIICVDAGSTDGTVEILEKYASTDPRITIIHSDKKSYGYQMNIGINRAKGEYIGIVETDDYILPEMYEKLYSVAKENNLDVVKSDWNAFVDENSTRKFSYRTIGCKPEIYGRVIDPKDDLEVFYVNYQNQPGLYLRSFIMDNGLKHHETPGASFQDVGFKLGVLSKAKRYMFYKDASYMLRRDNPNSSVHNKGNIYVVADEIDWAREQLRGCENEELFSKAYAYCRMTSYEFTLTRIAKEFQREFLIRYSEDFKKIQDAGELDHKLFTNIQWQKIQDIIECPDYVYYSNYYRPDTVNAEIKALKQELKDVRKSASYKIGRTVTWLPRKIRSVLGGKEK